MFDLRISISSVLSAFAAFTLVMQPVSAQNYSADDPDSSAPRYSAEDPDNSGQVDITRGLAEQNGMYAMRNSRPPRGQSQVLQGYATQSGQNPNGYYGQAQNQGYMNGYTNQSAPIPMQAQQGYNNMDPMNGSAAMNPMNGSAGMMNGSVGMMTDASGMMPMNGANGNAPMNGTCQSAPMMNGTCTTVTQQSSTAGFGITKQVVGVLGAAMIFNYATQGGAQTVLGNMGARGWRGGRRTLGSGGVVFH